MATASGKGARHSGLNVITDLVVTESCNSYSIRHLKYTSNIPQNDIGGHSVLCITSELSVTNLHVVSDLFCMLALLLMVGILHDFILY